MTKNVYIDTKMAIIFHIDIFWFFNKHKAIYNKSKFSIALPSYFVCSLIKYIPTPLNMTEKINVNFCLNFPCFSGNHFD